jgi:hypothetical protein
LAQCAGVGCGLVRVVAGEERVRKVFNLEGPPGDGETSRLGSRDPVDSGTRCRPHGGDTSKTKSWTIEPVHGGGRVKWFGGRPDRARGFGALPTKPSEDGFLVWASKQSPRAQHDGDGIRRVGMLRGGGHTAGSHGLRREDARCGKGVTVRWQDPQTLPKCPYVGCIASS